MTNHDQQSQGSAAAAQAAPELAPRLVLFFAALVIGGIVAVSFGHGVNIYGDRMEQSAIKLQGNPEQFEKTADGKLRPISHLDWLTFSLTNNPDDKGAKSIENSKPEFYYRFSFDPGHLTSSHRGTQTYSPTTEGTCERILLDEKPIDPDEPEPFTSYFTKGIPKCHYTFDLDDFFTWDIKKPEAKKDWTDE